jgi:hypothetical protein
MRKRPLDAPLDGHRVRVDLAIPGDPGVGGDLHDQGVLTTVALSFHVGQAEVDGFNAGDLQIISHGHREILRFASAAYHQNDFLLYTGISRVRA